MDKIDVPKNTKLIFIQKYYPECNKQNMEGINEFPCYSVGSTDTFDEFGYIAFYTQGGTSRYDSVPTPDLVRLRYGKLEEHRINMFIADTYIINIDIPIEDRIRNWMHPTNYEDTEFKTAIRFKWKNPNDILKYL